MKDIKLVSGWIRFSGLIAAISFTISLWPLHHADAQQCATLTIPDIVMYGSTASFAATITSGTYIAFAIDFGDSSMEMIPLYNVSTLPATVVISHNYTMVVNGTFTTAYSVAASAWSDSPSCNTTVQHTVNVLNKLSNATLVYPNVAPNYLAANVSIELTEGNAADFLVFYGDGTNSTQQDEELFAINSATGLPPASNQAVFTHVFAGVTAPNQSYFMTTFVSNLAGGASIPSCAIMVEEQLRNFSFTGNSTLLWPQSAQGQWTIGLGSNPRNLTNQVCIFTIGIGTAPYYVTFDALQPLLSPSQPISITYNFTRADTTLQYVAVNCSNDISYQAYNMSVTIDLDYILLGFSYSGPLYWNNTVQFALNITRFGYGACIELDMGDNTTRYLINGSATPCSGITLMSHPTRLLTLSPVAQVLKLNYSYAFWGNYTVTVRGYNIVNNVSESLVAIILPWTCSTPNVTGSLLTSNISVALSNPFVTTILKGFTISSTVRVSCMKNEGLSIQWTVFGSAQFMANPSTAVAVLTGPNSTQYTCAPYKLPKGTYVVQMFVSMYNHYFNMTGYNVVEYAYINVTQSPLAIGVMGAPVVPVTYNVTTTLYASNLTYDPDIPVISNKTGITAVWLCKQANESWPISPPTLYAHFYRGNNGGCFGDGPGIISNYTTLDLTFDTALFMPLTNYTFRLEIQKDVRTAAYNLTVEISAPVPPVLTIGCTRNCLNRVVVANSLVVQATCISACSSFLGSLSVVWSLYVGGTQNTSPYNLYANLSTIALNGINGMEIILAESSLQQGIWYQLVVSGTTPVSLVGTESYVFLANKPPSGGTCSVSPTIGTAMVTNYVATCSGWQAFQGPSTQLTYEFYVGYRNTSDTEWFYSGTPPSTPIMFPLGNPADNYMCSVYVTITDSALDTTSCSTDLQMLHSSSFDVRIEQLV